MVKRIIVIEDQTHVRENLIETLVLAGYEVQGAPDGIAGVELVRATSPDLILCDVMMPRLDGYGVLEMLQQNPATAAIPLIFLTAKAEREDLRRGMNLGATDYITKPFFQDELLRVVELRLSQRRLHNPDAAAGWRTNAADVRRAMQALVDKGRERQYSDRAPIAFRGDSPASIYYVRKGRVRLFRETEFGKALTLDTLGAGAWFGIGEAIAEAPFTYTVAGHPDAAVCIVPAAELMSTLKREPGLLVSVTQQLVQDLALRSEQLLQVAYFSVRKRVGEHLLREAPEHVAEVHLRREDIAEAIASTPESVTRVLTEFCREGLVQLPNPGLVVIADREGLEAVPA